MTPFFNVVVRVGEGPTGLVWIWLVRERVNGSNGLAWGGEFPSHLSPKVQILLCETEQAQVSSLHGDAVADFPKAWLFRSVDVVTALGHTPAVEMPSLLPSDIDFG
jgi:hypothetical protein